MRVLQSPCQMRAVRAACLVAVAGSLACTSPWSGRQATAPVAANGQAAAPTFYADVLPILYEHCQACHRSGGLTAGGLVAPMAFETYEQTRPWAPLIARAVAEGRMPPWGAHEQHRGTFLGERYLPPEDRAMLVAWAGAGALAGDPAQAPVVAQNDDGAVSVPEWWLGEPDLVIEFAEPVHVADDVDDWQPTIRVPVPPEQHTEPRWIRAAELKPGGPYVHHIVSSHLGVGTPGRGAFEFPEGWGILLPTDPVVTFNMHYNKVPGPGTAIDDVTRGAFKFHEPGAVIDHVIRTDLNMTRDFLIPAGHPNHEVSREMHFEEATYLLAMGPHMHYRGRAVKYELEYPDGEREVLLWVPRYDFAWQILYQYREPFLIPAGSTLHTTWWFDNSADNLHNPDPTMDVGYGIETYNEMANARIYFASAEPRGIVVGEPIPDDVLRAAREAEDRRRRQLERSDEAHDHE